MPRLLLWRPGKNRPTALLEIELGLVNCLWLARSYTSLFIRRVWTCLRAGVLGTGKLPEEWEF